MPFFSRFFGRFDSVSDRELDFKGLLLMFRRLLCWVFEAPMVELASVKKELDCPFMVKVPTLLPDGLLSWYG